MIVSINIYELFYDLYRSSKMLPPGVLPKMYIGGTNNPHNNNIDTIEPYSEAYTFLGKPIINNIKILDGSYYYRQELISYKGINLVAPLIEIYREKNIIETATEGKDGAIKEYIANGDYQISIRGFLFSNQFSINGQELLIDDAALNQPPFEAIKEFEKVMNLPVALGVESKLFEILDITNIVIKNYQISETGYTNTRQFQINAVSDNAPEKDLMGEDPTFFIELPQIDIQG